jgi:predicted component of type VI protein secretion system
LPHSIKHNGKTLELISITFPKGPHIVLEEQKEEGQKTLFMIDLSSNSAVIGRGHDCDIRLTDISVSRKHSKFFMQNGRCLVKDLSSKFGTLLFTHKEIMLEKERVVGIQIGRNLFKFKCKVKSKCWVYCCESDSPTARANPPETDPHSPISFRTK